MADSPTTIRGWPGGMNNVLPDYDLPVNDKGIQNALRNIVNADVLPSGRIKRRSGSTLRIAGSTHSFFSLGDYAFAVIDNVLCSIAPDLTTTPIATLSSAERVSYLLLGDTIYYSNGADKGRIIANQPYHWGVENPAAAPTLAAIAGSLPIGQYMSVVTFVDAAGEESGCGRSAVITTTAASGIRIGIPQPSQAYVAAIRIYLTSHNDGVLHEIAEVPVGTLIYDVVLSPVLGMALETQFMAPFLATDILEEHNGRIYGVNSNILWHTQPLRYGLYQPSTDFIIFAAPISVLAAVDGGLYVVADRTYWLAGDSPEDFTQTPVLQYTAAKGSLCKLPNSNEVVWYSSAGMVKAGPGGQVKLIQEPSVRGAPSETGASLYIEDKGIKKIISSVSGEPFATGLSSTDYMDAEIERARR